MHSMSPPASAGSPSPGRWEGDGRGDRGIRVNVVLAFGNPGSIKWSHGHPKSTGNAVGVSSFDVAGEGGSGSQRPGQGGVAASAGDSVGRNAVAPGPGLLLWSVVTADELLGSSAGAGKAFAGGGDEVPAPVGGVAGVFGGDEAGRAGRVPADSGTSAAAGRCDNGVGPGQSGHGLAGAPGIRPG